MYLQICFISHIFSLAGDSWPFLKAPGELWPSIAKVCLSLFCASECVCVSVCVFGMVGS